MTDIENEYDQNVMTEYFIQQHQIATELMLGLTDENNRKIASKWLHYLYDADTRKSKTSAKLLIVQGLILMMNANILVSPLNTPPTPDTDLIQLSECHFMHLINHELNKMSKTCPKEKYEVSEDRKEYVAYQKIPGYGSHFCYVYGNDPVVRTEEESGIPIIDENIRIEKKIHPLIQKYVKEIRACMPPKRTPTKFKYHDLTESFGGMKMPDVDPDDDVEKEYELVKSDGEIGQHDSMVMSDLDGSDDRYDQFAQDPAFHDQPRITLKETVIQKERESRALMEQAIANQEIIPQSSPKFKRTVATRVRSVKLQPVQLGNKIGLVAHIPKDVSSSFGSNNNRRDLIQALHELEDALNSSSISGITPNVQQAIDKCWRNPLIQNLKSIPDQHMSLQPPPKLDFDPEEDKNQTF